MNRTVDTLNGEAEYVVAQVVEKTGKTLATATFQVGLGTTTTPPGTWVTPSTSVVAGPNASVGLLVTSATTKGANLRLWVRVIDNPETYNLLCGNQGITVL